MNIPTYVQRSRKAGAKQPPETYYCGRHNGYNPFANRHNIEQMGQYWYLWADEWIRFDDQTDAHNFSVTRYKRDMADLLNVESAYYDKLFDYKYLSCWCSVDMPCHVKDAIIPYLERRARELEQARQAAEIA